MPVLVDFQLSMFEDGRSEKTIEAYISDIQQFSKWFLMTNGDDLSPQRLTATDLREYKQYMALQKAAPATINRRLAAIRAYAEWGHVTDQINHIKGVKEQPAAPRWLERRDVAALMREAERAAAIKSIGVRNLAILTVMLNTGLRVSEICALECSDVEITERKGELVVRNGKGEKTRTVPLNKTARRTFMDWMFNKNLIRDLMFKSIPMRSAKMFGGISSRTIQKMIGELGHQAKVEVTPHSLRHTFAKQLIDSGVGMEKVAALLGHSNLETTRAYISPGQADLERAVETLD